MKTMTKIIILLSVFSLVNFAQSSYNTTLLSRWNTTSGPVTTIASQGDTVFFNTGFTLNIVDFSESSNPVLLYQYNYFSTIKKIRHYDKYLVIHLNNGLKILDVENPTNVTEVWDLPDASIKDFELYESNNVVYLYLIYSSFFKTVIVTNPIYPLQIVNFPVVPPTNSPYFDLSIYNNNIFVVYNNLLKIYNVNDPANPDSIGVFEFIWDQSHAKYILVNGNYIYTTFQFITIGPGGSDIRDEINVLDYSDPSNIVRTYWDRNQIWKNGIFINDKALIINDFNEDFEIYSLTNPALPQLLYLFETFDKASDICLNGNHVFIADRSGGVLKVNISGSPELVGQYQVNAETSYIYNIKFKGNYVYLTDLGTSRKIRIVDVNDPYNPVQTGSIFVGSAYFFDVSGDYTYVVNPTGTGHIQINTINVSDPYNPYSIGITTLDGDQVFDMNISGNYLFICRANSFYIIDISNPSNLVVKTLYFPEKGARHSFASQNYLYVVSHPWEPSSQSPQRVYIFDISDPVNPNELGYTDIITEATDIEVYQNKIFISTWLNAKLYVIDASIPSNPQIISTYTSFVEAPWNIKIKYPYLYLVDNPWGTKILDITNPQAIEEVGLYKNQYTIRCDAYSNKIYTADKYFGMSIIQNDLITSVEEEINLPEKLSLSQNYPNPFNPSTTIKYQIPAFSFVTIKVYDVLGNEVGTLVNGEKSVGNYEVEFEREELPSGIYFYQLRVYPAEGGAGQFVETKKMVLIK